MPAPTTFQDGGLQYGSQVATLVDENDESVDYVLKNITVNYPTKVIVGMDEVGVPNKQAFISDRIQGSATGQYADENATLPQKFTEFTLVKPGGEEETFFIVDVTMNAVQDGEKTFGMSFTKKLAEA